MKAGVYYGVEDFRVAEFPEPELKEDGVNILCKSFYHTVSVLAHMRHIIFTKKTCPTSPVWISDYAVSNFKMCYMFSCFYNNSRHFMT